MSSDLDPRVDVGQDEAKGKSCVCGHSQWVHREPFFSGCTREECGCTQFIEEPSLGEVQAAEDEEVIAREQPEKVSDREVCVMCGTTAELDSGDCAFCAGREQAEAEAAGQLPKQVSTDRDLLRALDDALLDGPGGEAEAALIYAAREIERLSPNDPTPSCLCALVDVLAEWRAAINREEA